jgi:hypothetical protein
MRLLRLVESLGSGLLPTAGDLIKDHVANFLHIVRFSSRFIRTLWTHIMVRVC